MLKQISLRIKSYLRRRHKFSLVYSFIFIITITYFIILPNLSLIPDNDPSNHNDNHNEDLNPPSVLINESITNLSQDQIGFIKTAFLKIASLFVSKTSKIHGKKAITSNSYPKSDENDVIGKLQQAEKDLEEEEQQERENDGTKIQLTPEEMEEKRLEIEKKLRIIKSSMKKPNSKLRYDYFQKIFKKFHDNKPKVPPLNNYSTSKRIYHARYDTENKDNNEDDQRSEDEKAFSESYLSQFLQIDDEELESMTESHAKLLSSLDDTPPEGIYSGNGIVFVGGGSFNWLTLLSVKSIRALGSEMPIEILIPKLDEYELDICARIFPALSARCIYLPYALSDPDASDSEAEADIISKFEFKGYQYKALAILLSSFENVLLLDSDNIPVHRPDYLFSSEPFTNNGLIVWPDFWRRATSPYYYKIAGIPISKTEVLPKYDEVNGAYVPYDAPPYEGGDDHEHLNLDRIPLHQRKGAIPDPTSESGQLMISKSTHSKALHLALYYNLYGPNYFYPLFSQGSDGEGDKETFLAATVAVGKPFYQVAKFLNAFGYFNSKNEFEGTGMGQYDPVEDYEYNQQRQLYQNNLKQWEVLKTKDHLLKNGPRILFVHANFPKLNPWKLKSEKKIIDSKGNRLRLYGTGMKVRTGYDFEFVQWSNMKFLLCDLKIELITFKGVDRVDLCKEIHEHLLFLKSTMSSME